jgi:outer membrane protease
MKDKNNKHGVARRVSYAVLMLIPCQTVFSAPFEVSKGDSTLYLSTGQTSVEANELVYCQPVSGCPTDYKLSQLIWEVKNNPILIGGFSYSRKKTTMTFEVQTALDESDGVMDDYDWQYLGLDWSDWSHHEDTSLSDYNSLDLSFDHRFYGTADNAWKFLLGYRESNWAWDARGGSFVYSTIPTDYRDVTGFFTPGLPVIAYEQEFSMPYVGIKYQGESDKWTVSVQYEYSNWVSLKATDHHYLPDLIFIDDFDDGDMSAYKIGVAYKFTRDFQGLFRYDAREYDELRGSTITRDSNTGAIIGICENCAGADNTNSTWSIGISYSY